MCARTAQQPNWTTRLFYGAVFLLPLACWPQLGSAFATPKILLWTTVDVALAAAWIGGIIRQSVTPAGEWLALAWVAAVSISSLAGAIVSFEALLLALLPVPVFWCIARGLVPLPSLARAIWLGTTCEAVIVVLQFCGLDPLRALGWQPEAFSSPRMRIYGTFGNPDFVAAWGCAALPLCWREIAVCGDKGGPQVLRWAAGVVQVAAILATGSRVFAFALPLWAVLAARRSRVLRRACVWALPIVAALLYFAPTRPLAETIEGRLYLAGIAASNWQTPVVGFGPGSFEERFAVWQMEWLQAHSQEPGAARFAGVVDHAHNDYLEFLVDYGPVGLGVFLGLAGWVVVHAWRGRAPPVASVAAAAAIGAATLLAIAAVDFPFHRPAEWSLLWLFFGILARRNTKTQGA